jgi:hypothetical protein
MPPAADPSNPDRYDLISDDLEEHILKHPEGAYCMRLLYGLYDQWTGHTLLEESLPVERALKSREGSREQADKAAAWYLANAVRVQKDSRAASYTKLSVHLRFAVQQDPSARIHLRSEERIRRYLNDAARRWYVEEACNLLKMDPDLNTDELKSRLIDQVRETRTVFFLSRETDIAKYLSNSVELWYVRRGVRAALEDPRISRNVLADRLMGDAVREAEQYFRPRETVLDYLENADLGVS